MCMVVQDLAAHTQDRVVRRHASVLGEAALHQAGQLLLVDAGSRVGHCRQMCLGGHLGGAAHLGDLFRFLASAQRSQGLHHLGARDPRGVHEVQVLAGDLPHDRGCARVGDGKTVDAAAARDLGDAGGKVFAR